MYKYKNFNVEYKKADTGNGMICGYCSTFDEEIPDCYGDVIAKGAFTNSLAKIEAAGHTIPFVWSHRMDDLDAYLGSCKAHEDDHGLYFEATLDDTPQAQRVRQLFKDGRLSKFSFAYNVINEGPITLANGIKANQLRELEIMEITACLVPANPNAEVTCIKADKIETKEDSEEITEKSDSDNAAQAEDQNTLNGIKEYLLLLIKSME